jgi:hypothetical protein
MQFGESIADLDTLAMIKGSRIYMSYEARKYPDYVLKYILATNCKENRYRL